MRTVSTGSPAMWSGPRIRARILDVAYRMASMPISYNGVETNEWESALVTAGGVDQFRAVYGEVDP